MKYDFVSHIDRKGKDSIAVEPEFGFGTFFDAPKPNRDDIIPMWVADMNLKTLPGISEAIINRASHPSFGYFSPRDDYFNGIINWQLKQNDVEGLTKENIGYENGVLGGVASVLRTLINKGDPVLVHSPTYIGFTHTLEDGEYKIIHSPLVKDDNGVWRMDYSDMDKKIKDNNIKVAILCNPHNPCGRVWSKEELEKAYEVYKANNVTVISDEIWSDIILFNNKHIPSQSINEDAKMRTVALYAPSKTFNLAGLIGSYHIIYNNELADKILKVEKATHYNEMNVLSMYGAIAAFSENGRQWVKELRETLSDNVDYAYNFIKNNFDGVELFKPEGTYMLFIDAEKWCKKHDMSLNDLRLKGIEQGVLWQDGRPFGGEYTIRINLALPKDLVVEAFNRLDTIFNCKG